jgi:hypothetical protein
MPSTQPALIVGMFEECHVPTDEGPEEALMRAAGATHGVNGTTIGSVD